MDDLDALLAQRAASAAPEPVQADQLDALLSARAGGASVVKDQYSMDAQPFTPEEAAAHANDPRIDVAGSESSKKPLLGEMGRQLGLTGRAAMTGLSSIPNMLGDGANSLINLGTGALNKYAGTDIPAMKMPSQVTQELMSQAGVPEPQNNLERGVQATASSMAGVSPSVAMGKLLAGGASPTMQAIGTGLQAAPGMQILGAGGSGAGGALATAAGGGTAAQLGASLLGGMAGVGAASGITAASRRMSAPTQAERLAQALKDAESNAAPDAVKPRVKLNVDGTTTPIEPKLPNVSDTEFTPPMISPTGGKLPTDRQLANIDVMRRIGLNDQRPSAISGDKFIAGQEHDTAKLLNPMGEVARIQLQKEQSALKSYADGLIQNTGAPISAPEVAGQTIRAPMQALSDHMDGQIKQIYASADEKAGGLAGVKLSGLGDLLETNSMFAGKAENSSLRRGIRAYMKEQDISGSGGMQPITVETAEGLRQYLNSQWSPQNSGLIGKIKEALDFDVTKSAGEDVYKQARAVHAQRANTLDNPNGIAKLLNIEGPNGINQSVPDEKVAQNLLKMPTGQFKHILDTIGNLPDEIAPQGQKAIAEIKAAFARRIYAAGDSGGTQNGASTWNAANVTRELNVNRSKMALVFTPQEMAEFQTLHDAGHILQTPSAYKGAAAQGFNFLQSGAVNGLPAAGAGFGALLGGPMGATVGSGLGAAASKVMGKSMEKSMAQKYAEALSNPIPQFSK